MVETFGIIGGGSWATALVKILTDNKHKVNWWIRNENTIEHIRTRHHNPHYLQSVNFDVALLSMSPNLEQVIGQSGILVIAVPSAYLEESIGQVAPQKWEGKKVVSAVKGILPGQNILLNYYLQQKFNLPLEDYFAVLGPCHAEEVAAERLSYLTFSGLDEDLAASVAGIFRNDYIHTTHNHDIWGAQYAAVLNNIYAIGAGMALALDYGDNFLSVYITACYREMWRFLKKHFKKIHPSDEKPDFHTSAYLGDLLVTCYSLHSRNRTFGTMIGKGYSVKAATLEMNMVAEGYNAARGMQKIAEQYDLKIPIATRIYEVLWEGKPASEMFAELEDYLS